MAPSGMLEALIELEFGTMAIYECFGGSDFQVELLRQHRVAWHKEDIVENLNKFEELLEFDL